MRPWKPPSKAMIPGPMGVVSGELDRPLDCLGTRVREEDARPLLERSDRREALHQLEVARLVEVGGGDVDEPIRLLLDRRGDLRVGMPGRADGDAGGEVEEAIAVDIGDDHARPGLRHERVGARERRAGDGLVAGDDRARLRARQLGDDVRSDRLRGSRSRGRGLHGGHKVVHSVVGAARPARAPWLDRRILAGPHGISDQARSRVDHAGPQLDEVGSGPDRRGNVLARTDPARGEDRDAPPADASGLLNGRQRQRPQRRAGQPAALGSGG